MTEIDILSWFSERCLYYTPKHFVVVDTPITKESRLWIYDKLRGRFSLTTTEPVNITQMSVVPAFEDPQEAVLYELTWS